jgi:hypothetical protein
MELFSMGGAGGPVLSSVVTAFDWQNGLSQQFGLPT